MDKVAIKLLPRKLTLYQQRKQEREAILADVACMAELKNAAAAIIDYIYTLSPNSRFMPGSRCEWILRDRNWVAITFSYGLTKKKLHVSLDIWPENLSPLEGVERKKGRFPGWARVTLEDLKQLPTILLHIQEAFNVSGA